MEGAVGIESIISNLVSVLEELGKSIKSQNSLNVIKQELISLQEASSKVSDKTDQNHIDHKHAMELSNELQLIIGKVQLLALDMMKLNEGWTSSVKEEELSNLLLNCKKIGSSLDSHIRIQDRTKTPPSSPVLKDEKEMEFVTSIVTTSGKDLKELGANDNLTKDKEVKNVQDVNVHDSSLNNTERGEKDDSKKGIFGSLMNVSRQFSKTDDLENQEDTISLKSSEEAKEEESSGFLSSIKQRFGGFFYSQSEPKSDDGQEVEEVIESKYTQY